MIVDTGVGVASVRDELADLIDRPVLAVGDPHPLRDHVGGLHEFDDRVMHRLEAPRMAAYRELAGISRRDFDAETLDYLASIGYPISAEHLIDAIPHDGYDPAHYGVVSTTITREVDDGDRIDLGDRSFEVLHLPRSRRRATSACSRPTTGVVVHRRRHLRRGPDRHPARQRHRRLSRNDGAPASNPGSDRPRRPRSELRTRFDWWR